MAPQVKTIRKLLIANRAEIALRVIRACREMGIQAVAVYSDVDRNALHVQLADEAYPLRGVTAAETYLSQHNILEIAHKAGVDAIHPGYGFLSENPTFAEAVHAAGFIFVGPSAASMQSLGDKTAARRIARQCGIPTIAGSDDAFTSEAKGLLLAEKIGFPVLLKAAAGGGGKGMRVVQSEVDFHSSFRAAQSEARSAFGDERVYLEKYIDHPRHIEIQILADNYGNTIYLGERECSIQRRHQKVIEEAPSSFVTNDLRRKMGEAAVQIAQAANYKNAGTVEFLVDEERKYYFLEVNTRLQVEHPVTELITGIDLVQEQLRIAEGYQLDLKQENIAQNGHALECRIYAEDPSNNFFPSVGKLERYQIPQGPRVRVDNGFQQGDTIPVYYDPLMAKVVTWGKDRTQAITTMRRALHEFQVEGVMTTIPFCKFVLNDEYFVQGNFNTHFVQQRFNPHHGDGQNQLNSVAAVISAVLIEEQNKMIIEEPQPHQRLSRWKRLREEQYRT